MSVSSLFMYIFIVESFSDAVIPLIVSIIPSPQSIYNDIEAEGS